MNKYSIIISTFSDKESAKITAKMLVEQRLAACVQLFPIESIYLWKDKITEDDEIVLLIKSKTELFEEIATFIKKSHSYEVPEIIQIPITDGLPQYLNWIDDCVGEKSS